MCVCLNPALLASSDGQHERVLILRFESAFVSRAGGTETDFLQLCPFISYNWLFQLDYTCYKWGYKL